LPGRWRRGSATSTAPSEWPEPEAATRSPNASTGTLSPGHRADIARGCPYASFAEAARRLDPAASAHYAKGLAENLDRLAQVVNIPELSEGERRARAIVLFSEMAGALLLARAVADADPALSDKILESARADLCNRIKVAR